MLYYLFLSLETLDVNHLQYVNNTFWPKMNIKVIFAKFGAKQTTELY